MAEQKFITFDTKYTYTESNDIAVVILEPASSTPDTVATLLNESIDILFLNNEKTLTGQLTMLMKDQQLTGIDYEINSDGELIVHGINADNYDMVDGELIYTYK
jgi:CRISPR/Cas system-associated endonuclease Cas1